MAENLTPGMSKLLVMALTVRCPDHWCEAQPRLECVLSEYARERSGASLTRCLLALLSLIEEPRPNAPDAPKARKD